jgi:ABC-type cobalamin/Fe3+-siderophores transport system ATPase subunit
MSLENSIQNKKLELIQWLSTIEDPSIIEQILKLRRKESQEWWNSIQKQEKESIEQGLKDANLGKFNPHSSARKLYEKWL